jgi:hypothetical protein
MKLGWLWIPVIGIASALVESPLETLAALAFLAIVCLAAMAAQDKISGRHRDSNRERR